MKRILVAMMAGLCLVTGAWASTWDLNYYSSSPSISSFTAADGDVITGTMSRAFRVDIGNGATVTLRNAIIDGMSLNADEPYAGLNCSTNATIIIEGDNLVSGFQSGRPGIRVRGGCTVTIKGTGTLVANGNGNAAGIGGGEKESSAKCGKIVIEGTPTITATAGYGGAAGIGGGKEKDCDNITIHGGTITAQGGENGGAGIGAGAYGTCGNILIDGGTIRATGGYNTSTYAAASGIGAGFGTGASPSTCGNITIKPGIVSVRAIRRHNTKDGTTIHPAGIGAGYNTSGNNSVGTVSIADGLIQRSVTGGSTVTLQQVIERWDGNLTTLSSLSVASVKAFDGTTITGTLSRNCKITIAKGAKVTLDNATIDGTNINSLASDNYKFAGISCEAGFSTASTFITLTNSNSVSGFYSGYPGIYVPQDTTLYITGSGYLTAVGNGSAAGIGGGDELPCGGISITPHRGSADIVGYPNITATGGRYSAGIGGGHNVACGFIYVCGENITATGGEYGAGIGSGYQGSCATITLSGRTITATGGRLGAGIGSGCQGSCATITLSYGTVTATGGNWGAGIGGGAYATFGDIRIERGNVTAIGGDGVVGAGVEGGGAGIGGGFYAMKYNDSFGNIVISGGTVTATGGEMAAGIGSGAYASSCGNVTISSGITRVEATHGDCDNVIDAIGSGDCSSCGLLTVDSALSDVTVGAKRTIIPYIYGSEQQGGYTWYYRIGADGAELVRNGDACAVSPAPLGILEIPATLGGSPVTRIGDSAFQGCTDITRVSIPDGVTVIGGDAFYGCISLKTAILPASLKDIGSRAFSQCPLEKVRVSGVQSQADIDAVRSLLATSDSSGIDVSNIAFVELIVWNGNLATLDEDMVIDHDMTIYGELDGQYKISIADGVTVTLNNAIITNGVNDEAYSWAGITCEGDATIVLANGSANFVRGFYEDYPGIYVPVGSTLTISGSGSLDASGNVYGAGIGGRNNISCGSICIESGTITAIGGLWAAGIGGGYEGNCDAITITGGSITAFGGGIGAGIGCGRNGSCGMIVIEGGAITATGGTNAAGIGGSFNADCGNITITGGSITATGGTSAAAIGGGREANCGDITIGSGITSVVATRNGEGEPIGAGADGGTVDSVTVDPSLTDDHGSPTRTITAAATPVWNGNLATLTGDVTIDSDMTIYGELAGPYKVAIADGVTVTLDNATITNGGISKDCAGITCLGDAEIVLAPGSVNTVTAFNYGYPGIYVPADSTLCISGTGTLNATGGMFAAAIGGGNASHCGQITIVNGTVNAVGGNSAAAIGGGDRVNCAGITIYDGTVTATADGGAGIGSGYGGYCGPITINGGSITATGGHFSAGIGGGNSGSCGAISITGGTVVATGMDSSAGIGAGSSSGGCGAITIGAGITRVVAICSDSFYNAIGDGNDAEAVTVTVDPSLTDDHGSPTRTITAPAVPVWNGNLAALAGDVTIDTDMTIYGELAGQYKISIANGVTVTLNNAVITNGVCDEAYSWAGITCEGDATIVLANGSENFVKGFYEKYPGIYVPKNKTLTIRGDGSLDARSNVNARGYGYGAGIGGGYDIDCGSIVIDGGTVNAIGGNYAAGIGSGNNASCDSIAISNGTVVARCALLQAPGIGAGYDGSCGDISITGGSVTATGGNYAAGIGTGSGYETIHCGDISITGGRVTAIGGRKGAGIGSADGSSSCGNIYIGADIECVEATCGSGAVPIGAGGGSEASCGTITIDSSLTDDHGKPTRSITSTTPSVQSVTIDGVTWYYRTFGVMTEIYNDGNPAVSPAPSGALEIPATLGGSTVTAIGDFAFVRNGGLTSVILPDGVTSIGQSAFYGCSSLASVTIPKGVASIGNRAFGYSGLAMAYVGRGRTNAIKEMLLANGHDAAFVNGITFVEPVWNGNLATLDGDIVIDHDMTLYGELTGQYKISIANGVTVTLNNAIITNGVNDEAYSWAGITCEGDATIVLANGSENFVCGFYEDYPGIHVPAESTLTISGSGSLDASSNGFGAGIGGGYNIDCGNITIEGGTIVASGGCAAAGIGGGCDATCGDITILGGNVTASSDEDGSGIGSGLDGESGDITIEGGNVTATGGSCSAGIGGGNTGSCGSITIGAGIVRIVATVGNNGSAPIGAGVGGTCGTITIESSLTDDHGNPTRTITGSGSASGYASWASDNGVTGEWNAVDANGIANVFRYVFNKPTGAFTTPPLLDITFNAEGKAVVKTPPVANTTGFTISIVASDNADGSGNATPYALNASGEKVIDETGKTARFFRLKVEQQD